MKADALKVNADMDKCIGSGMCTSIAPTVFDLDEDGRLVLLQSEVPDGDLDRIKDAIACCPVEALSLGDVEAMSLDG